MSRILELSIAMIFLFALIAGWFLYSLRSAEGGLRVAFLSVGEGDAILIADGRTQVLIDGGMDGRRLTERLGAHIPFYDRTLEAIIATHPDADHIGGLAEALRRYRAKLVLGNGAVKENGVFEEFARERDLAGELTQVVAGRGTELVFPSGAKLLIRSPETEVGSESNEGSIIVELIVSDERFVFLSDAPADLSERVLDQGPTAVLKVAHHGARKETHQALLEKLAPREAVVSVGPNRYGHPAVETLTALAHLNIPIRRTDQEGDIVYVCSGGHCARER